MKRIWLEMRVGAFLIATVTALACGKLGSTTSSETNWLSECVDSDDCDFGGCRCGVCTNECESSADCSGLKSASCASPDTSAYDVQCSESPSSGGICLPACSEDRDCAAGQRCVAGSCVISGETDGGSRDSDLLRLQFVHKLDLLLVVDNSPSMADKQELLALTLPGLVERLTSPLCVSQSGDEPERVPAGADGECDAGYEKEFDAVDDIHVGIISSSLGGHGGNLCSPQTPTGTYDVEENDRGLLLGSVRDDLDSFEGQGFLAWDPTGSSGGETDADALKAAFTDQVMAVGVQGCDYPAPLEAWFRFLIDPSPPLEMVVEDGIAEPARDSDGVVIVDEDVLAQRTDFLRPDSTVVVVMVSDRNDCSVVDGGIGYLVTQGATQDDPFTMPESTSACDTDPNSTCCRSCGLSEVQPPSGCDPLAEEPKCQEERPTENDPLNLRCFHQKQRFGFDLLYPIARYVDALTQPQIFDTHDCIEGSCPLVENPLFSTSSVARRRDPSLVFLMGIVGVPWQDIATPESLTGPELQYKSVNEMLADGTFDVILGDPPNHTPPGDPLMVETPFPREGENPVTGDALAATDSTDPEDNPINGHEFDNPALDDLQYACIFPLMTSRDCTAGDAPCDCHESDLEKNRPLCSPPEGGAAGTTQYWGKAYPGIRQLHLLRDMGPNALLASICPKVLSGSDVNPSFGFNAGLEPLVGAIKELSSGNCMPRMLPVDEDGIVSCAVVEATVPALTNESCSDRPGRTAVDVGSTLAADTLKQLAESGLCDGNANLECEEFELCEIDQLRGNARDRCLNEVEESDDGFCYIDPEQDVGSPSLVDACPADEKRRLRFVSAGSDTPLSGAIAVLVCEAQ